MSGIMAVATVVAVVGLRTGVQEDPDEGGPERRCNGDDRPERGEPPRRRGP